MEKKSGNYTIAAAWFSKAPSLIHFNFLVSRFFTGYNRQAYMQHAVSILCCDPGSVNRFIQGKAPFKSATTVFSLYPVKPGKAFRWCVRNRQLHSFQAEAEIFFNAPRCKYQHFKTVVCFVNINGCSLHRTDEQVPVPVSGKIAFCGT